MRDDSGGEVVGSLSNEGMPSLQGGFSGRLVSSSETCQFDWAIKVQDLRVFDDKK